ncbi:MAG: hypothetical protein AB7I41_08590 [Candidatus Sericytochromatia bacterium]
MFSKHPVFPITLQISLTPWDLPQACLVLPHQLQFWSAYCAESLVLWDLDPGPKIQTEQGQIQWQRCLELLPAFQQALQTDWPNLIQMNFDLRSPNAQTELQALGQQFFSNPGVSELSAQCAQSAQVPALPRKDFRGGPFAAYFIGLQAAQQDLVLHLDGDMLFGGSAPTWIEAALDCLANHPDCLCVAPPGGPPANVLADTLANMSAQAGIEFQQKQIIFTTRCFLIRRSELYQALPFALRLPEREGDPGWYPPFAELVEVILTRFMQSQNRYRMDYSPEANSIWSLHPPTPFDPRYLPLLPTILKQMQRPHWPAAQWGVCDLLPSSLAWLSSQSKSGGEITL